MRYIIFAPNNHTNQLKVSQDLNICLKDWSDISLSWTRFESTEKPRLHLHSTPLQPRLVSSVERFHARDRQACKVIGTKESVHARKELNPAGLVCNTNMIAISLFCDTNMAAVTS